MTLTPASVALLYIIGTECIHLLQIRFTPDLLTFDQRPLEEQEQLLRFRDIYPFLFIELAYIAALIYLLFSEYFVLRLYAGILIFLDILKIFFHHRIKNRFLFIKIDSTLTIVITSAIYYLVYVH